MSFTVPSFPFNCNIRTSRGIAGPPRIVSPCNLAWGRRVSHPSVQTDATDPLSSFQGTVTLLLPAGTDIRDGWNSTGEDGVEVPAGSGRFYKAYYVDDIGKGFANEHRGAVLVKIGNALGFWPTPVP